jgi:hypothetical protein
MDSKHAQLLQVYTKPNHYTKLNHVLGDSKHAQLLQVHLQGLNGSNAGVDPRQR